MDAEQKIEQMDALFKRLANVHESLARTGWIQQVPRNSELWTFINEVGQIVRAYASLPRQAAEDVRMLVRLAGKFDDIGAHSMADVVEEAATLISSAASPHTHFYHFFYLVKSLFNSYQTVVMGEDPKNLSREWLERFGREWQELLRKYHRFAEDSRYKYSRKASLASRLLEAAQSMDERGEHVQADILDRTAAYVAKYAEETPQDENAERPPAPPPLSTRYCPDHRGVSTFRISDEAVQCPLDGRIYDYQSGYVDYEGRRVPGGSVAAQTPGTSPCPIPMRVYDSRQTIFNTLN